MSMKHPFSGTLLASTLLLASAAQADNSTLAVSEEQRQQLELTLYSQDIAQVRESRQLPILQPGQAVQIQDVSALLQPQTLQLTNAGNVIEQNYNSDLISYQRLLRYYIGKKLQLAEQNQATGIETLSTVRLLSTDGQHALIERNNNVESLPINSQRRFIFPSRPPQLTLKPAIGFRTGGTTSAKQIDISYLTTGLSWQTDYVVSLNREGNLASLKGMATLHNRTGTSFPQASIKLLAGSLSRPAELRPRYAKTERMAMAASVTADAPAAPQALQSLHLYTLEGKIDLLNNQQKQLPLFSTETLNIEKLHQLDLYVAAHPQGQRQQLHPQVLLQFENSNDNGLGVPMPGGAVRVFSPDSSGTLQYTGGSNISDQPREARVSVQLGQAFDLTVDQHQTGFEKIHDGVRVSQRIVLKNSAKLDATLELNSRFQKRWRLDNSSHPHEARGDSAHWKLTIPAESELELTFQVRQFNQ